MSADVTGGAGITSSQLQAKLMEAIGRCKSQNSFARQHGVSQSLVSVTVSGRCEINAVMANALGYIRRERVDYLPFRKDGGNGEPVTTTQLLAKLMNAVHRSGTQRKFATAHNVSQSIVSLTVIGERGIDATIANALGYIKRVQVEYVPLRATPSSAALTGPQDARDQPARRSATDRNGADDDLMLDDGRKPLTIESPVAGEQPVTPRAITATDRTGTGDDPTNGGERTPLTIEGPVANASWTTSTENRRHDHEQRQ